MNLTSFLEKLDELEKTISIFSPIALSVKRTYWGAPAGAISDLPCIINTLAEPERILGYGGREQRYRVTVQLLVARATPEDTRSSLMATAFWFAAKDAFDRDTSIGGTVSWSTIRGADPTVPVILQHAGQAYIGFSAVLDILDVTEFSFEQESVMLNEKDYALLLED